MLMALNSVSMKCLLKKYIDEDININSSNKKVIANISGINKNDIDKFKFSMKYKNMLDRFLALYFYNITSNSLMLGNFQVLSSEEISSVFKTTENSYSNNLSNRIELTIDRLCRIIEDKQGEIMNVADDVAESIGLCRSDLVVRHGEEVKISEIEEEKNIPEYIAQKIVEYKEKGYKTIAIISKTELPSNYINDDLATLGINIPNVSENDDLSDERFRVCTISNGLVKGLEFDAVIINNANENIYPSSNPLDMKLLYVAVTRALHELDIVYTGEVSTPLENHLKKHSTAIN